MQTWIALLRGINVGGNNILPMQDLRGILDRLGYKSVCTYIQSGNCVFRSSISEPAKLEEAIGAAIEKQFGFCPQVFVMTLDALTKAIAANPYPQAIDDPKNLHFSFLSEPTEGIDFSALEAFQKESEDFTFKNSVFYLHAPEGIGRSKLAGKIPGIIPVPVTGRNLRSVLKIAELAKSITDAA